MKKSLGFLTLIILIVALTRTAPAFAFTVSGDLSSTGATALSGSVNYTGTLSNLFDTVGGTAEYIDNGTPYNDMFANQDYIVATSSNGNVATFSVGEITVGNSLSSINITGNSSTGYTITGPGQSLSNVTNINVVHTSMPAGTAGYSSSFTINGTFNQQGTVTFNSSNFPGTYTTVTVPASQGNSNNYTGVSLDTLLSQAGVNVNNLNQIVIATGIDGGEAVLSMDEIVDNSSGSDTDLVATLENGSALSQTRGYARLILPTDNSTARSIFTLSSLTVESTAPVPEPCTMFLLGAGLVWTVAFRKIIKIA